MKRRRLSEREESQDRYTPSSSSGSTRNNNNNNNNRNYSNIYTDEPGDDFLEDSNENKNDKSLLEISGEIDGFLDDNDDRLKRALEYENNMNKVKNALTPLDMYKLQQENFQLKQTNAVLSRENEKYNAATFKQLQEQSKGERQKIQALEAEMNRSHLEKQKNNLHHEHETKSLQIKICENQNIIGNLKQQLSHMSTQNPPTASKLTETEVRGSKLDILMNKQRELMAQIKNLQKDNTTLLEKQNASEKIFRKKETEFDTEKNKFHKELSSLQNEIGQLSEQNSLFKSSHLENKSLKKKLSILDSQLLHAQSQISDLKVNIVSDSGAIISDQMKSELARLSSLETQFHKAKQENMILNEKLRVTLQLEDRLLDLQKSNSLKDSKIEQLSEFQVKYENLLKEQQSLQRDLGELGAFTSPAYVLGMISDGQKQNSILQIHNQKLNLEINQFREKNNNLEGLASDLNVKNSKLTLDLSVSQKMFTDLQIQIKILKDEKRGFEELIESYKSGFDTNYSYTPNENNNTSVALKVLEKENVKLEKEVEKLRTEVAILEKRVGLGEFDSSRTKVVHLKRGPHDQEDRNNNSSNNVSKADKQKMEVLSKDNEKLLKKIEYLEEAIRRGDKDPLEDMSMTGTQSNNNNNNSRNQGGWMMRELGGERVLKEMVEEKEEMERKWKDSEKNKDRLVAVFRNKAKEYRKSVNELFGFRVDFVEGADGKKELRLKSAYAESETDELVFAIGDDGLELLETGFSLTLQQEIDSFLLKCHSIPAFLANLTMELFNRKTFAGL